MKLINLVRVIGSKAFKNRSTVLTYIDPQKILGVGETVDGDRFIEMQSGSLTTIEPLESLVFRIEATRNLSSEDKERYSFDERK